MTKLSTGASTKEVGLTLYNDGFGLVKERRRLDFYEYGAEIIFADVAQKIETDSLMVTGLNILEFNYDYDLVNRSKLLAKYIDKEVFLKDRKTGVKTSCRLLSVEEGGGCVLEDNSTKEIYLDPGAELILPSLPTGLIVKPALVWKTDGKPADEVQVSYLSGGFNWEASYVVELGSEVLNITGWATINNTSGMTFRDAQVKLIAGEVNRVKPLRMLATYVESRGAPQAEEKDFFDYHMYTLKDLTTLKDNQAKQVCILAAAAVKFRQYYRLSLEEMNVEIVIEMQNSKSAGLGLALPKGAAKLYKADADGALEFVGEDLLEHVAKEETIKLVAGAAFDLTFEYKEVERKKSQGFEHIVCRCLIKNQKKQEAPVLFEPYLLGYGEIVRSSHRYTKKSSRQLEYLVTVAAEGEETVEFEYKIDRRIEIYPK